uniref:Uncharacterized protein n=1 Tax=Anopheles atroparvus TaxID=41427 RepID=A0AAG5CYN7_ANOAO
MMSDASLRARDDFISPSAAITFARASRAASASAAIERCSESGSETSYISTRSTCTPHGSVASSSVTCIECEMASRSVSSSERLRVPSTFRRVVAASSRVEWL